MKIYKNPNSIPYFFIVGRYINGCPNGVYDLNDKAIHMAIGDKLNMHRDELLILAKGYHKDFLNGSVYGFATVRAKFNKVYEGEVSVNMIGDYADVKYVE